MQEGLEIVRDLFWGCVGLLVSYNLSRLQVIRSLEKDVNEAFAKIRKLEKEKEK